MGATSSGTGALESCSVVISDSTRAVSIKLTSKLMKHMLENGQTVVDVRIVTPSVIDVDIFCETLDDAAAVNKILNDRSRLYTLTTKGLVFSAMMLANEKLTQSPDVLSAMPIHLTFKQVLVENSQPIIYAQPADSSYIDKGFTALRTASNNVQDLISSIKSSAATAIDRISQAF